MSVTLKDITELDLEGNGSFDKLMRAVRLHIADARSGGDITQEQAGAIYTGIIPTIIQESVRFEMQKDLLDEQLQQEVLKTAALNKDLQIKDAELSQITHQDDLTVVNIEKARYDINLSKEQLIIMQNDDKRKSIAAEKDIELKDSQLNKDSVAISQLNNQIDLLKAQINEQTVATTRADIKLQKDIELKDSELSTNKLKMEATKVATDRAKREIALMEKDDTRRDSMFQKDIELKDSDKLAKAKQLDAMDVTLEQNKAKTAILLNDDKRKERLTAQEISLKELDKQAKAESVKSLAAKTETTKIQNKLLLIDDSRKGDLHSLQLETSEANIDKIQLLSDEIRVKTRALSEQLVDNRWIKTIQNMGSFLGAGINGGVDPSSDMYQTYFGYMAKLNGVHTIQLDPITSSTKDKDGNTISDDCTVELETADNTGKTYPYGGVSKSDPNVRNDFTANVWKIDLGYTSSTDDDGAEVLTPKSLSGITFTDTSEGTKASDMTCDIRTGDIIMQTGTPEKPVFTKIENRMIRK